MTRFLLHEYVMEHGNHFAFMSRVIAEVGLFTEDQEALEWCVNENIWHAIELFQATPSISSPCAWPCSSLSWDVITLIILIENDAQACFMRLKFPEIKLLK